MKNVDWKALKPHVPLGLDDAQYVPHARSAGEEIANWVRAGRSPILVGGPAGVGKSTELAHAAQILQSDRIACLVQLDRSENMRRLTPDRMLLRIIQVVGRHVGDAVRGLVSVSLGNVFERVEADLNGADATHEVSAGVLLNAALREIIRISRHGKMTLLVDGLEKVPPGNSCLDLFEALATIDEAVDQVVIIPWHAAFGPQADTVIRLGERFVAVRALDPDGDAAEPVRRFFFEMLARRLGWPIETLDPNAIHASFRCSVDDARSRRAEEVKVVTDAVRICGGLPRVFLQLLGDAGTYAKLRRSDPWPIDEDFRDACEDHTDSFRRLLLPGDIDAIRTTAGTNGSELDLDRKIRLMAHGVLLERVREGVSVLDVHPLARAVLGGGGRHA